MRLLVSSDAGVPSGFGVVTEEICGRLVRDYGHDVHVIAANFRGDHVDTALKLYVANQLEKTDVYGLSRYVELLGRIVPDAVLFINDPAIVLDSLYANPWDTDKVLLRGVQIGETMYKPPLFAYLPIDGYSSPGSWDALLPRVKRIAMSHHGQETMPEAPVVWHGVDSNVFKVRDRKECKKALGFDPERFLILRVDKNSIRKDYPATWKALRPILRKYPDIDVHFHCLPRAIDGYNLYATMWNDADIRERVSFSPNLTGFGGWGVEQVAMLHSAADLFISTSWGEGFGLNNLNSIAAGTPVIATACSATTEVVGPGGVLIPPAGRITTPMGQEQCLPDIDGFTAEIEHLYKAGGVRRKLAEAGVDHSKKFSWDFAAERVNDLLLAGISQPTEPAAVPVTA